jgi:hypothetical protein
MRLSFSRSACGVVLLVASSTCGGDVVTIYAGQEAPAAAPEQSPPPPPDPMREPDAAWVFDEDAVHVYHLQMLDSDWTALQSSALEERYFPATLSVDGIPYGRVGLRFKGSRGTLGRCGGGVGTVLCPKISMKIKFDEYDDSQRFFGLKRLNFNSMWADKSWLHERLAYQLYRDMGIDAPRAGHARIIVNDDDRGIFSLVEQIDGRFTDDRFAGGDGNLYKEQWPIVGNADQLSTTLETNEEVADHSVMIRMYRELAAAAPEALPDVLGRYWDIDQLLAHLAVDRTITNWDGATGFYCRGGGCYNHNYYLYQHEHEDRFSLIPWDLDNTFRPITPFDHMPGPRVIPDGCPARYPAMGTYAMAIGCDPLFRGLALVGHERYLAQLTRLLDGPFELGRLNAWIDARVKQLAPHAATDTYAFGATAFELAIATLRADLQTLVERVRAEQEGAIGFFRLNMDALNDFEGLSPSSVKIGVRPHVDHVALLLASLDTSSALRGNNSLALDFRLAPEADPTTHWLNARISLPTDSAGLGSKSGVRMLLRADRPRDVRISFESEAHSITSPEGFGWTVPVDATPREVELKFAEVDYPATAPASSSTLADVLATATALLVQLRPLERGVADAGTMRVDDIQFTP